MLRTFGLIGSLDTTSYRIVLHVEGKYFVRRFSADLQLSRVLP